MSRPLSRDEQIIIQQSLSNYMDEQAQKLDLYIREKMAALAYQTKKKLRLASALHLEFQYGVSGLVTEVHSQTQE